MAVPQGESDQAKGSVAGSVPRSVFGRGSCRWRGRWSGLLSRCQRLQRL